MAWLELTLTTHPQEIKKLERFLLKSGAVSITLKDAENQPVLEPGPGETPLWDSLKATALFPEGTDLDPILRKLQQQMRWQSLPSYQVEQLADQNWERAWMDQFKPMQFGKRLWICPSEYTPPEPDAINIILDPGLAFGTGTHPTTALCLTEIDSLNCEGLTVIDYGCGSGILGLAAAKLGAKVVHCVDNDPQALTATLDNAEKNSLNKKLIKIYLPEAFKPRVKADVLLANILAKPLMELCPYLCGLVKSGGKIILSGILHEQEADIIKHYEQYCTIVKVTHQEDWCCVMAEKRD
jgi:ribosomal protein L11 methyltransferase